MKILVTTYPFKSCDARLTSLIERIKASGATIQFNEKRKKYTPHEARDIVKKVNPDILIAGTESYSKPILDSCPSLKMISRVGIGTNSIDLNECKERGIVVTNTPVAPVGAVSDLTVLHILTLLRKAHISNNNLKDGMWKKPLGRQVSECKVGIIGAGRIGQSVIDKIVSLEPDEIMYSDVDESKKALYPDLTWASKEKILLECDIISIHMPLTHSTRGFISKKEFDMIKSNAILVNTSRGSIVNEDDLYVWLLSNKSASAGIDVYENEPYCGKLSSLENIFLTPHIGPMTVMSRRDMAIDALSSVLSFISGDRLESEIEL